jgi:hypothetical protein
LVEVVDEASYEILFVFVVEYVLGLGGDIQDADTDYGAVAPRKVVACFYVDDTFFQVNTTILYCNTR